VCVCDGVCVWCVGVMCVCLVCVCVCVCVYGVCVMCDCVCVMCDCVCVNEKEKQNASYLRVTELGVCGFFFGGCFVLLGFRFRCGHCDVLSTEFHFFISICIQQCNSCVPNEQGPTLPQLVQKHSYLCRWYLYGCFVCRCGT